MRKVTITVIDTRFDDTSLDERQVEHVVTEMFKGGVYMPDEHMQSYSVTAEKVADVVPITRAAAAMVGMVAASLLAAIADDADFILGVFQAAAGNLLG